MKLTNIDEILQARIDDLEAENAELKAELAKFKECNFQVQSWTSTRCGHGDGTGRLYHKEGE